MIELRDVVKQGTFAWTKTVYLNQNNTIDRQEMIDRMRIVDAERWINNRLNSSQCEQLKDSRRNVKDMAEVKDLIFKNGIEIFKNRAELARTFTINLSESVQNPELVLLFKKGMKKVDISQSILSRNRSQDGAYLLDEDPIYTIAADPSAILQKSDNRCQQLNYCLTLLGADFDRKV